MEQKIGNLAKWSKLILKRDNYQCRECDLPHRDYFSIPSGLRPRFEAHHIIKAVDNPSLIFDLDNGITLCIFCHHAKHTGERRS